MPIEREGSVWVIQPDTYLKGNGEGAGVPLPRSAGSAAGTAQEPGEFGDTRKLKKYLINLSLTRSHVVRSEPS